VGRFQLIAFVSGRTPLWQVLTEFHAVAIGHFSLERGLFA